MKLLSLIYVTTLVLSTLSHADSDNSMQVKLGDQTIKIKSGAKELLVYQSKPLVSPIGGSAFKGSNFIHPLRTPSGFDVTDIQPSDHLHHFGLWWPWKYVKIDGRKIICWELQKNQGLIQGRRITDHKNDVDGASFTAESVYIDRTAPAKPLEFLNETTVIKVSKVVESPARGYFVDIDISQSCATELPVEIVNYRYSGFAFRGTGKWTKDNSTVLTSENKSRKDSNNSRAKWVRIQGDSGVGKTAGVVIMGYSENREHPERLRTWNETSAHNGAVFINFNPVQLKPWKFTPGNDYIRKYRLFVYDGKVSEDQADKLWKDYQ